MGVPSSTGEEGQHQRQQREREGAGHLQVSVSRGRAPLLAGQAETPRLREAGAPRPSEHARGGARQGSLKVPQASREHTS